MRAKRDGWVVSLWIIVIAAWSGGGAAAAEADWPQVFDQILAQTPAAE